MITIRDDTILSHFWSASYYESCAIATIVAMLMKTI